MGAQNRRSNERDERAKKGCVAKNFRGHKRRESFVILFATQPSALHGALMISCVLSSDRTKSGEADAHEPVGS